MFCPECRFRGPCRVVRLSGPGGCGAGPIPGVTRVQYLILIYEDEKAWASLSEADMNAAFGEYMTYSKEMAQAGVMKGGASLQPTMTATTVRVRNGKTTKTDGPFAETK